MITSKPGVALVDDHSLLRNGLATLIGSFGGYEVLLEARSGKDFIRQLPSVRLPDLVLLDINMSEMDGYETARWLKRNYPEIKVLALSIHTINAPEEPEYRVRQLFTLNERELEFMKLVCTEWTYKEIADQMCLSPRTIDGYRDALFEKLNVRTRVGLVMYAIRNGIVAV